MIAFLDQQRNPARAAELPPTVADGLEQAIRRIQTGGDLAMVKKRVWAAYQAGHIDLERAEALMAMAAQESSCLPDCEMR